MQAFVRSVAFGIGRNLPRLRSCVPVKIAQFNKISTSPLSLKLHKASHDKKKFPSIVESSEDLLKQSVEKMKNLEERFIEELDKNLSFRTDWRLYEDFYLTQDGQKHRLANLAQISRKGTNMIVVNLSKNPAFVTHAKMELLKAFPDINIQQEGTFLYIKAAQITRDRRKEMIEGVKHSLLNDYKKTLNALFSKYSKRFEATLKSKDDVKRSKDFFLDNKRILETRADAFIKEREEQVMSEIV